MPTVLDEDVFPIVSWGGPSGEMLRPDILCGMAEAGFTVSHSLPDKGKLREALDTAAEAGVRLLLCDDAWQVTPTFKLTADRKRRIRKLVKEIGDHPGLYAYYLCDEPWSGAFPAIAKATAFLREIDPYHLVYVNHLPVRQTGWGAGSMEVFWRQYIEMCKPMLLSWDLYCIEVLSEDLLDKEGRDKPWVFPKHKIWIKPWYFENLELVRSFGLHYKLPFWAFAMSVRHYAYPTPTEGHLRFQLMHNLAYGARGLQYFNYMGMIEADGTPREHWHFARKINREIHAIAPVLKKLNSINVCHSGPVWSGTRALRHDQLGLDPYHMSVACEGDPVTIGFSRDDRDVLHLMVVNKNPCEWARATLRIKVESDKIVPPKGKNKIGEIGLIEYMPEDGKLRRPGPPGYLGEQTLVFSPGQGRLLCVDDQKDVRIRF
jgi:hypothetical protein